MNELNPNELNQLQQNYENAMDELAEFQRESAEKLKELKSNQMKTWSALIQEKAKLRKTLI